MVFIQLAVGLCAGITLPQLVHEQVYLLMANSFVRPHLKLRMYLHNKNPNTALDTNFLDSYLKDVFGSFILFFLAIGPTVYQVHFKKAKPILKDKDQVPIMQDDKYTSILRKIKAKQQGERISELDDSQNQQIKLIFLLIPSQSLKTKQQ